MEFEVFQINFVEKIKTLIFSVTFLSKILTFMG